MRLNIHIDIPSRYFSLFTRKTKNQLNQRVKQVWFADAKNYQECDSPNWHDRKIVLFFAVAHRSSPFGHSFATISTNLFGVTSWPCLPLHEVAKQLSHRKEHHSTRRPSNPKWSENGEVIYKISKQSASVSPEMRLRNMLADSGVVFVQILIIGSLPRTSHIYDVSPLRTSELATA